MNALEMGEVDGILIDALVGGGLREMFDRPDFVVNRILDYATIYGVVLSNEAKKLRTCLKDFMAMKTVFITQHSIKYMEAMKVGSL